ncbi:hypothetical protein DIPPA_06021 [Diplonema papillatum]|nr:hypothetical protein DIPPA_06021 [Diplonema papillatum]
MQNALIPAAKALQGTGSLAQAAAHAGEGCELTSTLKALHGRTTYVREEDVHGVKDPGAVANWLYAVAKSVA